MSAHLGDQVSALVDGQLHGAARDRALTHVAGCPRCAEDVKSAREARESLRDRLCDVRPAPELMSRLLALDVGSACDAQPAQGRPAPDGLRSRERLPHPSVALCGDVASGAPRWVRAAALSALAATGIAAAGLFALGERPVVAPSRATTDALSVLASAPAPSASATGSPFLSVGSMSPTTTGMPAEDVFSWMGEQGWQRPGTLPAGISLTQVRFVGEDDATLEVDLEGPLGRVVLREQKGQLDPAALEGTTRLVVDGNPVYVVSDEPVHLVWQSSDTVIDVVSEMSLDDVLQLVSTFTVDEFDTGFQARVGRGWSTLTGVL